MRNLLCDWLHWRHWTTPRRDDNGDYRACLECGRRVPWFGLILHAPFIQQIAPQPIVKRETFASEDEFKTWWNKRIG